MYLPCLLALAALAQSSAPTPAPEVRAVWVDGFHAGIRSPGEVAELVELAKRARFNTVIVQVRRRGDALYTGGLEPVLDDPNYDPSFDGLATAVAQAHAAGLKLHAWINATPIWRDEAPPKDPRHVFNQHGPGKTGADCWLTSSREGRQKFPVGYFLDPGHPGVQDHLVSVYLDIVKRYAVDGIHFDYIRYPETDERLPRGANVGYNEVSLARFRQATRRSDVPAPDDEQWTAWRRQQVTQLVRRISIEARALKPRIQVSAATIAWGKPPASLEDFANVAPMQRIFQDWQGWLQEGLLDMAVPMNYAREHDEAVRRWFDGWIAWEKRHKADRQLVVGVGGYLSAPSDVLAQIARVRASAGRRRADGVSLYSYFRPSLLPQTADPERPPANVKAAPDRFGFLVDGAGEAAPPFLAEAPLPSLPWVERPTRGFLAGTAVDGATVGVRRHGWFRRTRSLTADGNGWFGMTRLKAGKYRVRLEHSGRTETVTVEVRAGEVARAVSVARAR